MHPSYIIYHIPVIQSAAHLIKQTSNHLNLPFLRADFYEATKDKQLGHLSIITAQTVWAVNSELPSAAMSKNI